MLLKAWSKAGNDLAARATRAAIREQMAGTRLGARAIVHGNLAQWGQGCQLPFKLLRPSNGYPDTVVLFTPTLLPPPGIVEELRRVNRGIVFKTIKRAQEGGIWGWKITVQQLSEPAVWVLDDYATRFDGKLSRLDVSIEFWPDCSFSLNSWLRDHLLLWFRAAGPMLVCENTVSWVDFRGGSAPARNGTLYTDLRASKLNGRLGSHLDTKICRARTIQRLGIHRPLDLLTLNPSELLPKVWRLVTPRYSTRQQKQFSGWPAQLVYDKLRQDFRFEKLSLSVLELPAELKFCKSLKDNDKERIFGKRSTYHGN